MPEIPNLKYIDDLAGNDLEFRTKLIHIIKEEFPAEKATYEQVKSGNKYVEIARIVHKLKHKISILGYEKGYDVALKFENSLKERTPQKTLQVKFDTLLNDMDDFIANL